MGRTAAFGRPPASERFRKWWNARSKTSRQNIYLALGVGALFVAIMMAATARDQSPATRRVIASRPQPTTTLGLPTPSTVNVGDLGANSGPLAATDLLGLTTTTTTPAPATTAAPATRPASTVATTEAPRPATTVTNPDVIFSTVPPATTTTTQPPVTTTRPPTTTTTARPTTTTLRSVPLSVPPLLAPG
jgi:hypothetical protein